MRRLLVVGVITLLATVLAGEVFAASEPPPVRTLAGRHQQVGSTEVSGWFSATLFADGSFTVLFYLGSLDCDFIDFRASHSASFIEWSIANPFSPGIVTFRPSGEFSFDAATVVLDAPLWVHPFSGAVQDQGLFRRCGIDDMVVAFRLTIRAANFVQLGRYDGDISATLLSGATIQRSFSGTLSTVSPMPFRPVTGFRVEQADGVIDRVAVPVGGCFRLRWHALPGAAQYALEYVGPDRRFSARAFSSTPESRRDSEWGVVLLPPVVAANICTSGSTPPGSYEIRIFGLDNGLNVVAGSGSSVPMSVSVFRPWSGSP